VRPKWEDGTPAHTVKKFGIVNRYDLREEFPILTLAPHLLEVRGGRASVDLAEKIQQHPRSRQQDLGQLGGRDRLHRQGVRYQLGVKHQYKEGMFDQVDRVLFDLKNNPASRRIMTNIYNFQDLHEMHLYPCAYSMTFNVSGKTLNGILNQRSQDMSHRQQLERGAVRRAPYDDGAGVGLEAASWCTSSQTPISTTAMCPS
jgi:thymidylate synthase